MKAGPIRVLVVEEPGRGPASLARVVEQDSRLGAIGPVSDAPATHECIRRGRPAVVLVDWQVAGMEVFDTIRAIMESHALPIVVCAGGAQAADRALLSRVLDSGAIALVEKPGAGDGPADQKAADHLRETVRLMSEVKVVRRTRRAGVAGQPPAEAEPALGRPAAAKVNAVAIGASTGGPPVLRDILARLPADFPAPVLVVQHIADGFLQGMAGWLRESSALPIHIAAHGMPACPGQVYLAPHDFHMAVGAGGTLLLTQDAPVNHVRPAVSVLFRSMAQVHGAHGVGVILTGMGKDGAAELKLMRDHGAVTIAQDRATSIVHGMPGAAIALGAAVHVLAAGAIAAALIQLTSR